MALARIKDNRLIGQDYIKYCYEGSNGNYPRIDRKWNRVPIDVCYDIEKTGNKDFEVHYEVGEESSQVKEKLDKQADDEIERRLNEEKLDLNKDGKFDDEDAAIAGKVLAKFKNKDKKKK